VIDFSFAKEKDKLAIQVNILSKDDTLYIFVVSDTKFNAEIVAVNYENYKNARKRLHLIEPAILRAWETFKDSFPKCACDELIGKQKEILKLAHEVKAKLYRALRDIVDLKEPELKPSPYLVIVQKEGKNEIPLN